MKSRRQSSSGGGGGGGGGEEGLSGGSKSNTSSSLSLDGGERGGGGGVDNSNSSSSSKMERKDVEKNRRLHMKGLCLKLSSLMPATANHHQQQQRRILGAHHRYSNSDESSPPSTNTKEANTQLDHLEKAAEYIKQLRERIDDLKQRKHHHQSSEKKKSVLPVMEVRYQEGTLDVALVTESAGKPFRMHEVITALEEEGAEVMNASLSVVGDKVFYTLHSQALCSRVGLDASRISHRLGQLQQAVAVRAVSST